MKIKIKCVSSWALFTSLLASSLSGCSSVQSNPMYSEWQTRAYGAYGMNVPQQPISPYMTTDLHTASAVATSDAELHYIAEHYALR
jgi:hypothetical protein